MSAPTYHTHHGLRFRTYSVYIFQKEPKRGTESLTPKLTKRYPKAKVIGRFCPWKACSVNLNAYGSGIQEYAMHEYNKLAKFQRAAIVEKKNNQHYVN